VDAYPLEPDNPAAHLVGQEIDSPGPGECQPDLGSPIHFRVWLRRGTLRPAWAALCGALASGSLASSTTSLLRLALLILLVDVVWGGLWAGLAATDWATSLRRWQSWRHGQPVRFLPYTSSNATAGRLARTWGHLRSWWTESGRPVLGPTVSGLVVLLPLALVIAGVLGARPLLATLAAITLLQFVFAWTGGSAQPVPGPQALFEIALPWLAAHALFDLPSLPSVLLGLAYAVSYAGGLRLVQGWPGLARWNLGQVIAVAVLVAVRQPLPAGIAGLLFVGQLIVQPGLFDADTAKIPPVASASFLRFAQLWLMVVMLVAAWGVRAAGIGG
jgi:hypothetical protein